MVKVWSKRNIISTLQRRNFSTERIDHTRNWVEPRIEPSSHESQFSAINTGSPGEGDAFCTLIEDFTREVTIRECFRKITVTFCGGGTSILKIYNCHFINACNCAMIFKVYLCLSFCTTQSSCFKSFERIPM